MSSIFIEKIWPKKIMQEKLTKLTKILNYIKSSCIVFICVIYIPIINRKINTFSSKGFGKLWHAGIRIF